VDLSGLPSGKEACFIREYTLGERDLSNVQRAMGDGYEPATAEMFPNANPKLLPGDKDETHGLIRRGGQILMIRDKSVGDAEREYQRQEVQSQKNAAIRLSEAPGSGASFDGHNFTVAETNRVAERASAGEAMRPGAKGQGRFPDA